MALAAAAAGADGLIIEVHPQPEKALSDGPQSLTLEDFEELMATLERVLAAVGRPLARPRSIAASERARGRYGVTSALTATDRSLKPARGIHGSCACRATSRSRTAPRCSMRSARATPRSPTSRPARTAARRSVVCAAWAWRSSARRIGSSSAAGDCADWPKPPTRSTAGTRARRCACSVACWRARASSRS